VLGVGYWVLGPPRCSGSWVLAFRGHGTIDHLAPRTVIEMFEETLVGTFGLGLEDAIERLDGIWARAPIPPEA